MGISPTLIHNQHRPQFSCPTIAESPAQRAYKTCVLSNVIYIRNTNLPLNVNRRNLLKASLAVLGFSGLSGCTSDQSSSLNGGTEPQSTPTETLGSGTAAASPTSTASETPVPFPETCESLPDIDGLPTPPSELTGDSVETFVRDFESVYAVATNDDYGGVDSLQIDSVETASERYIVSLTFDAVPATPTPAGDGETPTRHPPDAYAHRAVHRLTDDRLLRELRSHIDDSLLSQTCWTLEGE